MKITYFDPKIEIIAFSAENIITASGIANLSEITGTAASQEEARSQTYNQIIQYSDFSF